MNNTNGIARNRLKEPATPSDNPAAEALEELVKRAIQARASDIHLQMGEGKMEVRFRLDGVICPVEGYSGELAERLFGRIKFLAQLKTYQESLPQEGRISKADLKSENDLRVSTYPTVTGEKIVLRLFAEKKGRSFEELGYQPGLQAELEGFLRQTSGLLLLTGPAGSGKTTTIYSCLRHLQQSSPRHIITVEDPVEQILPGIMQTEISEVRGLTFPRAVRHLLRQDPEILVIGEIRDDETANLAVRAALTGHLVISTLHAGSCQGVVERLMVMVPDHYALFSTLGLILNQRLFRKSCFACKGKECSACFQTGYQGRIPAAEWVRFNETIRQELVKQGASSIKPIESLRAAAEKFSSNGSTTPQEIARLLGTAG